jgi:acyl carrier protein
MKKQSKKINPEFEKKIFNKLEGILRECAEIESDVQIYDYTELSDLGMDSLEQYEFCFEVESEIDIKIPDEEQVKLRCLGDYVSYITKNYKEFTFK